MQRPATRFSHASSEGTDSDEEAATKAPAADDTLILSDHRQGRRFLSEAETSARMELLIDLGILDLAAVCIQRWFRGYRARLIFVPKFEGRRLIARCVVGYTTRKALFERMQAIKAEELRARYSSKRANSQLAQLSAVGEAASSSGRTSAALSPLVPRTQQQPITSMSQLTSVVLVQQWFRRRLIRMRLQRRQQWMRQVITSAITIQRFWRGYVVRAQCKETLMTTRWARQRCELLTLLKQFGRPSLCGEVHDIASRWFTGADVTVSHFDREAHDRVVDPDADKAWFARRKLRRTKPMASSLARLKKKRTANGFDETDSETSSVTRAELIASSHGPPQPVRSFLTMTLSETGRELDHADAEFERQSVLEARRRMASALRERRSSSSLRRQHHHHQSAHSAVFTPQASFIFSQGRSTLSRPSNGAASEKRTQNGNRKQTSASRAETPL